jgi:hypothetical protein
MWRLTCTTGLALSVAVITVSPQSGAWAAPIRAGVAPAVIGGVAHLRTRAVIGGAHANSSALHPSQAPGVFGPRGKPARRLKPSL